MAETAIVTAVATICRSFFGCYPSIKNFICLEWNLRALKKEKNKLGDLSDKLKKEVDYSSDAEMTKWLREVEEALCEDDADLVVADKPNCCHVCLCYCCERNSRSQEVAGEREKVKRLLKEGPKTAKMVHKDYLKQPVEPVPGPSIPTQSTASKNLEEIVGLLQNPGVKRIGVWGMGGVGKTTLVRNLNNRFKDNPEFGIVILVTISQMLDTKDICAQVAERLNLKLEVGESKESQARRIRKRLEKQKFLLILDDVWQPINLDLLGVPPPEESELGSKIILTSRFLKVCKGMRTKKEVKVDVLNEEESWELFSNTAGNVATSDQIQPIAKAVAKECGGLPLALIAVGIAATGWNEEYLWRDALRQLKTSRNIPDIPGMKNSVTKSLKLSYNSLPDDNNIKPCFLFCCLYPADFSIDVSELIKCWLGEGLLDGDQNYEESYDRGKTLIQHLKDHCLLEDGVREGTVKMHDVVRIVAIWISSSLKDGYKSLVRSGMDLAQIRESDLSKTHKRVSFTHNKITVLPSTTKIGCPMSSTLLLQENQGISNIHAGFLRAFPALKVLNISGTSIHSLPESISQLVGLLVLIMRDCENLKTIQQVSHLTELQVLDCSGSGITSLPGGMNKIRQLYLSRTRKLQSIEPGIISEISGLEVLDMTSSAYIWDASALGELIGLKHLLLVSMQWSHFPILDPNGQEWIRQLRRYQFVIGKNQTTSWETELDGKIVILTEGVLQGVSSSPLLSDATSLVINSYTGLVDVLPGFAVESNHFAALKFLKIVNSSMLISDASTSTSTSTSVPKFDLIPNLETLHLINVQGLKSISALMDRLGLTLSRLREIVVSNCPDLKFLFGNTAGLVMINLQVIRIRFGDSIERIWRPTQVEIEDSIVVFPNLRVLEVTSCIYLRHIPLTALNHQVLQEIRGHERWWQNLEDTVDTKRPFERLLHYVETPVISPTDQIHA